MSVARQSHRVAVVVFCETDGVDEHDAATGARMALDRMVRDHGDTDAQDLVGTTGPPRCGECGVETSVTGAGTVQRHVPGETWSPEELTADNPGEEVPDPCPGSEQPPRQPTGPVIGFVRRDGHRIAARVHSVVEAGTALRNGYLWAQPTGRAFR